MCFENKILVVFNTDSSTEKKQLRRETMLDFHRMKQKTFRKKNKQKQTNTPPPQKTPKKTKEKKKLWELLVCLRSI